MLLTNRMPGFKDELEKISNAPMTVQQHEQQMASKKERSRRMVNRGVASVLGTTLANKAMGVAALRGMSDPENGFGSPEKVRELSQKMGLKPGDVQFRRAPTPVMLHAPKGIDENRNIGTNTILEGMKQKDPQHVVAGPGIAGEAAMAHELGHVKNHMAVGRAGRLIGGLSRQGAALGATPTTFWAGAQENPTWTPGLIQAGISAPMLADEFMASARAAKRLIGAHGLGQGLKKSLPLLPAFGTYATLAGAPLAITAGRKLLRKRQAQKAALQSPQEKVAAYSNKRLLLDLAAPAAGFGAIVGAGTTMPGKKDDKPWLHRAAKRALVGGGALGGAALLGSALAKTA